MIGDRIRKMKDGICFRSVIRRFQVNYAFDIVVHHPGGWGEIEMVRIRWLTC